MITAFLASAVLAAPPAFPPLIADLRPVDPLAEACGRDIVVTRSDAPAPVGGGGPGSGPPVFVPPSAGLRPTAPLCRPGGDCTLRMAFATANACAGRGAQTIVLAPADGAAVHLRGYDDGRGRLGVIGATIQGDVTLRGPRAGRAVTRAAPRPIPSNPKLAPAPPTVVIGAPGGAQFADGYQGDVFHVPAGQTFRVEGIRFQGGPYDVLGRQSGTFFRADGSLHLDRVQFQAVSAATLARSTGPLVVERTRVVGGPSVAGIPVTQAALDVLACLPVTPCGRAVRRVTGFSASELSVRIDVSGDARLALTDVQASNRAGTDRAFALRTEGGARLLVRDLDVARTDVSLDAGDAARCDADLVSVADVRGRDLDIEVFASRCGTVSVTGADLAGVGRFETRQMPGGAVALRRVRAAGMEAMEVLGYGPDTAFALEEAAFRDVGTVKIGVDAGDITTTATLSDVVFQGRGPSASALSTFDLGMSDREPGEGHATAYRATLLDFARVDFGSESGVDTPSSLTVIDSTLARIGDAVFGSTGGLDLVNVLVDAQAVRCAEIDGETFDGRTVTGSVRVGTSFSTTEDPFGGGCGFAVVDPVSGLVPVSTSDPFLEGLVEPGPQSPARDGGSRCGETDRLGRPRPQGAACDFGAVEAESPPNGGG